MSELPSRLSHDRFFWTSNPGGRVAFAWYYEAREGVRGPFPNRREAERDLARLVIDRPWRRQA